MAQATRGGNEGLVSSSQGINNKLEGSETDGQGRSKQIRIGALPETTALFSGQLSGHNYATPPPHPSLFS